MNAIYRQMADAQTDFAAAEKNMSHLMISTKQAVPETDEFFYDWIEGSMMEAIFGSNLIERAGTDYTVTADICRRVFRGETVEAEIDPRSPEYERNLLALVKAQSVKEGQNEGKVVLRSRLEVINHAKAMNHIVTALVYEDQLLTEKLILQTHAILCKGVANDDDTPSEDYAGKYRSDPVAVKHPSAKRPHVFVHPRAVPTFMENMCSRYKQDVEEIERTRTLDPFALASRYSHVFVNVHPFADGNGRMCRLILNAILLKYAGICAPIGEEGDKGRDEYLNIMHETNKDFLTEDADDFHESGHGKLAALVVKKASLKFKQMMDL